MLDKIKNAIKWRFQLLSKKIILKIKTFYFKIFPHKVECNICGWYDIKFLSDKWHKNIICPKCNSQIRQRLFYAFIMNDNELNIDHFFKNKRILHFAPDSNLTKIISKYSNNYTTADLLAEGYYYQNIDLNIDMSDMKEIREGEFDCVIAFDVLEHIPNHLEAIEETNRVLTLGGYCIFTIPQKDNLIHTYEDLSITDPKEREEKFGQYDHFRIYGSDFKDMLEKRGFKVRVVDKNSIDENLVQKYVLHPPVLSSNSLATNYRKIFIGKKINHMNPL